MMSNNKLKALSVRYICMLEKIYVYAVNVKLKDPMVMDPSCDNTYNK